MHRERVALFFQVQDQGTLVTACGRWAKYTIYSPRRHYYFLFCYLRPCERNNRLRSCLYQLPDNIISFDLMENLGERDGLMLGRTKWVERIG